MLRATKVCIYPTQEQSKHLVKLDPWYVSS